MNTVVMEQRKKIHPHKFTLWVGIAGILMMFAGLTSAFIVKRNQADWKPFVLPLTFWYSTAAIVLSSLTLFLAGRAYKAREMMRYRGLMTATIILGVLFILLQVVAFMQLYAIGEKLQSSVSISFLYVIVLLHGAHVIGGIIALIVLYAKAFNLKTKIYNSVPVEVTSTYWHFVDVLWIYLLLFLVMIN
ncbi:MAG: cytochrome c oxidase subunit 3 [Bacteroidetes bacterium]|nr:cytochrome c oxidase subunit 3 [Bacteroidota bacterium]